MITILDMGSKFGMPTYRIFRSWKDKEILHTEGLNLHTIESLARNEEIDLVSFGGGGDIHPKLYGHQNVASNVGNVPSHRDLYEAQVWEICQKFNIPVLGICRGAQLACALSGGDLIQDIDYSHNLSHVMTTNDGRKIPMTTAHHQMMWPSKIPHELIAWVEAKGTKEEAYSYDAERIKDFVIGKDPEIVYFPETKSLGIQGHPEYYQNENCESVKYVLELVNTYLLKGKGK